MEEKVRTLIISGFPGVGKSETAKKYKKVQILDLDSSPFVWLPSGLKNPDFPINYMQAIKDNIGKYDVIFVSAYQIIRDALVNHKIPYLLIYPNKELKHIYIDKYNKNGNSAQSIEYINNNWEKLIGDIEHETYPDKIKLPKNLYLVNILPVILENINIYGAMNNKNR